MTPPNGLPQRVEEASLNAWPALTQLLLDGWILRFTRGFTKRANCVVPLYPGRGDLAAKVRDCENRYAREGLQSIFRLTDIDADPSLDRYLEGRGYRTVDPTEVMTLPLPAAPLADHPAVIELSRDEWLTHYDRITGTPTATQPLHAAVLRAIHSPHAFMVHQGTDLPVSCGLAVAESDLVGLYDIATSLNARRAGHARAIVVSLLAWGRATGAHHAYLQVVASNTEAIGLYRSLGFDVLYRYWYRIGPA